MTTADVLPLLLRRWYVVLAGLVLVGVAAIQLSQRPGVYSTRFDVVFVTPERFASADTTLVGNSEDLIAAAGLVERLVNADRELGAATSQDVTLVGTGVRRGTLIRLPNSGGQWDYNFSSPMLSVQVAGPTAAYVAAHRAQAIEEINSTLARIQDGEGNPPADLRITTQIVPRGATILHGEGYPTRAAAGAIVVGACLTLVLTQVVDQAAGRRKNARGPRRRPHQRPELVVGTE